MYGKITFDEECTEFIGYTIERDREGKITKLSQHGNVEKALSSFLLCLFQYISHQHLLPSYSENHLLR